MSQGLPDPRTLEPASWLYAALVRPRGTFSSVGDIARFTFCDVEVIRE